MPELVFEGSCNSETHILKLPQLTRWKTGRKLLWKNFLQLKSFSIETLYFFPMCAANKCSKTISSSWICTLWILELIPGNRRKSERLFVKIGSKSCKARRKETVMQSPYLAHTVTFPIPLQYSIKSSTKALESVREWKNWSKSSVNLI